MSTMGRRSAVAGIAVGTLLLGGCVGGAKSVASAPVVVPASASPSTPADSSIAALKPAAIVDRAKAALTEAKTFRLKGFVTPGRKVTRMDLEARGSDVRGTVTREGTTVEILTVGERSYVRPDVAFWKANLAPSRAKSFSALVKGRWVLVSPTDEIFAGLFGYTDVDRLLDSKGGWYKVYVTTVDAKRAVMITEADLARATLYVAVEGPAYPLRFEAPVAADGSLTFSDFGAVFADLKAPPASEVVDFDELFR